MSFKEILVAIFGALVLIGIILGCFLFFLMYGDRLFKAEDPNTSQIDCSEENVGGLCGIRKFIEKNRSTQSTIDL